MSTIRTVTDADPILCWRPVRVEYICTRPKGHVGGCIAFDHIPLRDVSRDNPAWTARQVAA